MAQLYLRLKALYQKEGGAFPDPILNLHWPYTDPDEPDAGGDRARRSTARRSTDVHRSERPDQGRAAKRASSSSASPQLRDDGTTACGCWIYSGCFTEAGNMMARRDNTDPDDIGAYRRTGRSRGRPTAASSTTAPRAISTASRGIRAQADRVERREVDRLRRAGLSRRRPSRDGVGPFIMNPEGVGAPVRRAA